MSNLSVELDGTYMSIFDELVSIGFECVLDTGVTILDIGVIILDTVFVTFFAELQL